MKPPLILINIKQFLTSDIILPIVCFLLLLVAVSCNNQHPEDSERDKISFAEARDFITKYDGIWEQRDTVAMKQVLDSSYTYFSSEGSLLQKKTILSWFTPADKYKMDTAIRSEIVVNLNGNTAVVSSRWVGTGRFGEERFNDDQRCSLILKKEKGEIRLIAEHCTQIKK